jgi:hypothetical protein
VTLRQRAIILIAVLAATAVGAAVRATSRAHPAVPYISSCGVQRWAVKTLTDPAANTVNLTPKLTTIEALGRLSAPAHLGTRFRRTERTNFRVKVRLLSAKIEADGDVHLVIASLSSGRTMIAEFPSTACSRRSFAAARMKRARAAFERACGVQSRSGVTNLTGTATVTGVGFFDFIHHQRGVAPNGIELHPVLRFSPTACSRPASPPPSPPPPPPPPPPGNCAASYPSVCIPPPPPDLDCGEIAYRNFTVRYDVPDPDPHGFDGDRDGIGCES